MIHGKSVDPFYSSLAWRKLRGMAMLRDHGMCVVCMAEFLAGTRARPRRATTVHHIVPRTQRPDLALDLANTASVCDVHHAQAHPEKGERGGDGKHKPALPAGVKIVKI